MLKTSESTESLTRPENGKVGVSGDSRAGRDRSELDGSKVDGGEVGDDEVGKKVQNSSKSKKLVQSDFFIPGAKLVFAKLRQVFVKAPDKFAWLKNSLVTTFESIIVRTKPMELLTPCLDILNEVQRRKRPSKTRSSKFCTICSLR